MGKTRVHTYSLCQIANMLMLLCQLFLFFITKCITLNVNNKLEHARKMTFLLKCIINILHIGCRVKLLLNTLKYFKFLPSKTLIKGGNMHLIYTENPELDQHV